jgi:hypothetical protein
MDRIPSQKLASGCLDVANRETFEKFNSELLQERGTESRYF